MKKHTPTFAITISSKALHALLVRIAIRAYEAGHKDGQAGKEPDLDRVTIDPQQIRKLL